MSSEKTDRIVSDVSPCRHVDRFFIVVYGTLLDGLTAHPRRPDLSYREWHFLRPTIAKGQLYDTGKGYPGLVAGDNAVPAEVWCANQDGLNKLDRWEEYDEDNLQNSTFVREPYRGSVFEYDDTSWFFLKGTMFIYRFNGSVDGLIKISEWRTHHLQTWRKQNFI